MSEAILTRQILTYLKAQGCFAAKWHGSVYGTGGMPDIYALLPRDGFPVPLHIEVKAPGNAPTPRQGKVLRDLCLLGAVAFWTDTLDDVKYAVETLRSEGHVIINENDNRVCRPLRFV